MLRDRVRARIAEMGPAIDHQRIAEEVLGIRGAPPALARKLVEQALVIEDRRDSWRAAGERICNGAPSTPGVYILKAARGEPLYVGKAINLRRRLRAHFADRRWRAIKPLMSRAVDVEWIEVGSELEALVREAKLIAELAPPVNVQIGPPELPTREVPRALQRDVLVIVPSVEAESAELVGARVGGPVMIQRTRRSGPDLVVHTRRVMRFFRSPMRRGFSEAPLSPIVFSWLARRGSSATRIDPHDVPNDVAGPRALQQKLAALLRDERLFHERLQQC